MNVRNPVISIVVPVYNSEPYLEKCLDSLSGQTLADYEVILVNDGSRDGSAAICSAYAARDVRFRLIEQPNKGVAEARNNGLKHCRGSYVAFMDSDDWAEAGWLEAYWNALQQYDCDLFVQGLTADYATSSRLSCMGMATYRGASVYDGILKAEAEVLWGYVHNKLYRRELLENLMFRFLIHEDLLFNLEYACRITSLHFLPEAHYHYRQHAGDSLVKRRYSFPYMMSVNTSLRDARLALAFKYGRPDDSSRIWGIYLGLYTVLLASLYDVRRGISSRKKRIEILKAYQHERNRHAAVQLKFPTFAKSVFARLALSNPLFFDFVMETFSCICTKLKIYGKMV